MQIYYKQIDSQILAYAEYIEFLERRCIDRYIVIQARFNRNTIHKKYEGCFKQANENEQFCGIFFELIIKI